MAPLLAATAAAQRAGKLGVGQVAAIRRFYHQLPGWVDDATREQAEAHLAKLGTQFRGNQQADGMSDLRGCITPELRASLEAVLAKLAAPGMCNPHDDTACVDGIPHSRRHRA